jgi:uncharacterized protein (TIGR00369 family)
MGPDAGQERLNLMMQLANTSPFYHFYGMEVSELGEGISRLHLPMKEEFKNLYGTAHGGVLAALLDSTCSFALASLLEEGEAMVTLDMRVNFIGNVSAGLLTGEGTAIHKGRTTAVARGEVRDEAGKLVACGMSTCYIRRNDR